MQQSDTLGKLFEALAAAQLEMPPVPRTKENPYFKSKYADLSDVVEATRPVLNRHGLAVTQGTDEEDGVPEALITTLGHSSGEWIRYRRPLHATKQDPQGVGSAETYARRYSYGAAVGVVTDDDDDGQAASQPARRPAERSAAPAREATKPKPTYTGGGGGTPVPWPEPSDRPQMSVVQGEGEEETIVEAERRLEARRQLDNAINERKLPAGLAEALWASYTNADHDNWLAGLAARTGHRSSSALVDKADGARAAQRQRSSPLRRPMP